MSHSHHSRHKRRLKITIVLHVVIFIGAHAFFVVAFEQYKKISHAVSPAPAIQKTLENSSGASGVENVLIKSSLGFSVNYNKKQFTSIGYVISPENSFKTHEGDDLLKERGYAIINLYDTRVKTKDNISKGNFSSADMDITTSILADFFAKRRAEYGAQLSDLDLVEKHFTPKTGGNTESVKIESRDDVEVGGITYRKVVYSIVNSKLIRTKSITEAYYLVRDGKPIAITLRDANDRDQEFVASLRNNIENINYGTEQQSSKYGLSNSDSDGKVSDKVSETGLNTPYSLSSNTALEVVAKNQPATVRVGMIYCTKVTLKLANGSPFMTLEEACNGAIGSGSIISNKGYISTNGHVVTMKPNDVILNALVAPFQKSGDRTQIVKFLEYLRVSGQSAQVEEFIRLIQAQNQEAIEKLLSVIDSIPASQFDTGGSEKYQYAIQLGKKPLKIKTDGATMSNVYSKNEIVSAELVDKNFNIYDDIQAGNFTQSDVAVLKINDSENSDYPIVRLGSINGIKQGDIVTAIGYPGFVDGGVDTKQEYTFPTATQGKVLEVVSDSPGSQRKIVNMTTPIAQGNSGGPAFSSDGTMIGLNTYGEGSLGDSFSVTSTFRDVDDLKKLLEKNKVQASSNSELSQIWSTAIDDFSASRYKKARQGFSTVSNQYPSFYLADSFIKTTDEQIEIASKENTLKIILLAIVIVALAVFVSLILFIKKLRAHNRISPELYSPIQQQMPNQSYSQNVAPQQPQSGMPSGVAPIPEQPSVEALPQQPAQQTIPITNVPQKVQSIEQKTVEVVIDHDEDPNLPPGS